MSTRSSISEADQCGTSRALSSSPVAAPLSRIRIRAWARDRQGRTRRRRRFSRIRSTAITPKSSRSKQAGAKARGATLYVTLEPCCTTGRTGPCTKAIIARRRQPRRRRDARSKPRGRRPRLRRTSSRRHRKSPSVFTKHAARELNEDFAKWIRTRSPVRHAENRAHARRPNRRALREHHLDH